MEDKLKDFKPLEELLDSVRDIEGFPIGEDKDILALSEAPYYTACPNPYINDFIEAYGTPYNVEIDNYEKKPFIGDVTEGKSDPVYRAYTYHTQVPHKAIQAYVDHYTNVGDLIFDGFCGTGTTGVASQILGRNAIVSDLSPYASLIAGSCNDGSLGREKIIKIKNEIIEELKKECLWMYETKNNESDLKEKKLEIKYTVWSNFLKCPYCETEFNLWDYAVIEHETGKEQLTKFNCKKCGSELETRKLSRVQEEYYDSGLGENRKLYKQVPVLIYYSESGKIKEKKLNNYDLNIINKIENLEIPYWFPINRMPEGDEARRNDRFGMTHVHQFYSKRNLYTLSKIYSMVTLIEDKKYKRFFLNAFLAMLPRASKQNRYMPKYGNRHVGILSGTLYTPHFTEEVNLINSFNRRVDVMEKGIIDSQGKILVNIQSCTKLLLKDNSVDYIFTDPPFGSNIMYSELSYIRESWLKIITKTKKEAIINKTQSKELFDYRNLMVDSFKEYNRILKPNRWITIEFHNSKASVWNMIQESITRSGFIIGQVAVIDKKKGTINQLFSAGAVSKDLVIHAYKPKEEFVQRFLRSAGEGMEVEFIKQQFNHLPIAPNVERTEQMLYSKMLAHYIERGFKIKYNSHNFFELLDENFVEMDGFWFDEKEVLKYNEWKSKQGNLDKIKELQSGVMTLFITDEKEALRWIYNFLLAPRTYSDILTNYNQIPQAKAKDEIPELREMLDNNFFTEEGKYRRPYTRQEIKELMGNRSKELDRAWKKILDKSISEKKKMKTVRKEALEHGFKKCYDEENYQDILAVADKLHASILEENGDIMDFVDIAQMKLGVN